MIYLCFNYFLNFNWKHLADIQLADPNFGNPDRIDILRTWCGYIC